MQVKWNVFCVVLTVLSLIACSSDENGDDYATPSMNDTYIRFVSPSGTNVLDSLGIIGKEEVMAEMGTDIISISGIRSSDNKPLEMTKYWMHVLPEYGQEFVKEESLVKLHWIDFNVWDIEKRPYEYTEIYKFQLQGSKVFGDNEVHTLDWYVYIKGRRHNAFKCEVDGLEVSLADDYLYNNRSYYSGWRNVTALLTIQCK